jgi:hypothetical protein
MIMRSALFAILFGTSSLIAVSAFAQTNASPSGVRTAQAAGAAAPTSTQSSGPADLCKELLAYVEKKAAEPPKPPAGQPSAAAGGPQLRTEGRATGTQGGGTVGPSTSTDTSSQPTAPPTAPVATGAQSEAAASPYASHGATDLKIGDMALEKLRDTAKSSDRQACRDTAQKLRHAGADLPAALIALAAYEPDPAKRQ